MNDESDVPFCIWTDRNAQIVCLLNELPGTEAGMACLRTLELWLGGKRNVEMESRVNQIVRNWGAKLGLTLAQPSSSVANLESVVLSPGPTLQESLGGPRSALSSLEEGQR